MPTRWRSARRSVCGSFTVTPSNRMRPSWIGSRPLMQRSMVLLPDPERPMTAMISPGTTLSETSSRTVLAPKRLTTCDSSTSDMQAALQISAPLGEREAHREIDRRDDDEDGHRPEGRGVGDLRLAGELDEADRRRERGVLDQLNQETDRRRDGDPHRLRHDDVAQLVEEAEAERRARLPLRRRDRGERAAPDFAEEGAGIDRERRRRRDPRVDHESDERQAEIEQEQPGKQRRALDRLHVDDREPAHRRERRHPEEGDHKAGEAAAEEGDGGERDGPARGAEEVHDVDQPKLADHRRENASWSRP